MFDIHTNYFTNHCVYWEIIDNCEGLVYCNKLIITIIDFIINDMEKQILTNLLYN